MPNLKDILNRGILRTLPGHDAEVTAVKWIEDGVCFCSADQAGCMLVWRLDETYQVSMLSPRIYQSVTWVVGCTVESFAQDSGSISRHFSTCLLRPNYRNGILGRLFEDLQLRF